MKIQDLSKMSDNEKRRILQRSKIMVTSYVDKVAPIVDEIRVRGDDAVLDYIEKFDKVTLDVERLEVSDKDIEKAKKQVDSKLVKAIKHAITNIWRFHEKQLPKKLWFTEVEEGVYVGLQANPLSSVGLYVPAGKGRFPSVVPMLGVPAKVASVDETILCTPPIDGFGDPASLVAAKLVGVDKIFRIGGVSAIAAFAYGTATIPKVEKILGPGGPYVSAARLCVRDDVALGTPAGPSEVLVLADETADPHMIATELLAESEHGSDSAGVLVTTSKKVAKSVDVAIGELIVQLPQWRKQFASDALNQHSALIICDKLKEAIDFVNEYAPEHLLILTKNPSETCYHIRTAGSVFLGRYSAVSAGCYLSGSNAILPTGGSGRVYSATTIYDYIRFQCIEQVTRKGLEAMLEDLEVYADYEGFPAHKMAAKFKFN